MNVLGLGTLRNAEASPHGGTIRLRTYYEHSFRLRRSDSVGQALPLQVEALKNGTVFAYGLDVYNGEPKIHPESLFTQIL